MARNRTRSRIAGFIQRYAIGLLVILLIGTLLALVGLYTLAQSGDQSTLFNRLLRERLANSPGARQFFSLHQVGDARREYVDQERFPDLQIEVDAIEGCSFSPASLQALQAGVGRLTGRDSGVRAVISNTIPKRLDYYGDQSIRLLVRDYRNEEPRLGAQTSLYLLCLNSYADRLSQISASMDETTVVVFSDAAVKLAPDSQPLQQSYLTAAALHQFGHLLGLPDRPASSCLMAQWQHDGVKPNGITGGALLPCAEDKNQLDELRQRVQRESGGVQKWLLNALNFFTGQ